MTAGPAAPDPADDPLVTGQVVIPARCPELTDATMHISLEDTSYADRAATVVAELAIAHVEHPAEQQRATVVPFALGGPVAGTAIDLRHHYAVRVWVDGDGDGRAGPGDLHSDQQYPVLTRGHPGRVTIELGAAGPPAEGDPAP